ncbi:VCBS domain-containing protein, partial [Oleiphilus sp. HI0067]
MAAGYGGNIYVFTVVSISGPIFYVDKFGQHVQLRIGDKVSEDTLLNSPDGNQVVLRSPAGDTLSFIVKEPQLVSHFSNTLPDQSPDQFDPSINSSDSSISTSIRADAKESSQKVDIENKEDTKNAQAQSDGHHHDTPAVVARTNLEIDNHTDTSVFSSRSLASFGSEQDDALSNTINAQHNQLLANSSVHQDLPISITGVFDGSVSEDNQVSASGQLSIAGGPGSFASQSYQGQYGTLTIAPSGQWEYRLNSGATNVDALTDGQLVSEHFDIHAQNAGGVDFAHGLDIEITGTNDTAQITDAKVGDVTEDSQLNSRGQLTISDKDAGEDHFSAGDIQGAYGTLHLQQDGSWTYSLENQHPDIQAMNAGSMMTDTLIVHAADGEPHRINIQINGTNDTAVIGGTDSSNVTEESVLQAQGQLTIQDIDTGESYFQDGDLQGQYGTLHLQKDGSWTYDLNNQNPTVQALGQGKQTTDTITVTSADGTNHEVRITVQGTNDVAVVTDSGGHGVKEDTNVQGNDLVATGQLAVTDTDSGEAFFQKEAITGQYGTFAIDKDGSWQFTADNTQTAIQSLAAGQHITDSATVTTADGTKHDIVVTITGTTDHPRIHIHPADAIGTTIEDQTPSSSGTLSAIAVDQTTLLTWSLDHTSGKYGSISIDPQTGQWSYDLGQGTSNQAQLTQALHEGEKHIEMFVATVTDSHGTTSTQAIIVHVQGTNDAPVLNTITAQTATEGDSTKTTGVLTGSDIDTNDQLTFSAPNVDGFVLKQDGSYSFDPNHGSYNHLTQGDVQTITIPVTVTDLAGATDTKNLVITLTGTNDAPVLQQIQA